MEPAAIGCNADIDFAPTLRIPMAPGCTSCVAGLDISENFIELGHLVILCKLSQRYNTYLTDVFAVNSEFL